MYRILALSFALLLSLQLLAASRHHHDLNVDADHCASCVFAHHLPSGLQDADLAPVPVALEQSYRLEEGAVDQAPAYTSVVIPKSQAPPRA